MRINKMASSPTGECFDLLRNSPNLFFNENEWRFEFACGYRGLKGYLLQHYVNNLYYSTFVLNGNEFLFIRTGFISEQVMAK